MSHVLIRQRHLVTTRARRRGRVTALSMALTLMAMISSACGSPDPPASPASVSSSTSGQPSPATRSDPTGQRPSAAPTAEHGAGTAQFCRAISQSLSFFTTAATSPEDPSLDQGIAAIRQLADRAPAEIKPDLRVIADFDQHILDQVQAGHPPVVKETPELAAALTHEAKWTAAHCVG